MRFVVISENQMTSRVLIVIGLTLPRLKFVGFSSLSRLFMAHTRLEFWAVSIQPLLHGLTCHEPV